MLCESLKLQFCEEWLKFGLNLSILYIRKFLRDFYFANFLIICEVLNSGVSVLVVFMTYEPVREKTNNLGFRPGPTQTGLNSHRRWLEAGNFAFRK